MSCNIKILLVDILVQVSTLSIRNSILDKHRPQSEYIKTVGSQESPLVLECCSPFILLMVAVMRGRVGPERTLLMMKLIIITP